MATTLTLISADADLCAHLVPVFNASPSFHCVGVYQSVNHLCEHCRTTPSDLLLLDVPWTQPGWLEEIARLHALGGSATLVVLAPEEQPDCLVLAMVHGACGYVLREAPPDTMLAQLEQVARGCSPISGLVARHLIQRVQGQALATHYLSRLSLREREILEFLALGYPYKQIADQLSISINTVRTYVRRLYAKLEVPCRAHAVLKCHPAPWKAFPHALNPSPALSTLPPLTSTCDLPAGRKVV